MSNERKDVLRRENPGAWVVWELCERFPDRNFERDAALLGLVNEIVDEVRAEAAAR